MINPDDADLRRLCNKLAVAPTATNLTQLRVFMEAFQIFVDRNRVRGDAWQEYGAEDSALHCRSKALRLTHHVTASELELDDSRDLISEALDDGLDLINYAAFFVRNVRDGNLS